MPSFKKLAATPTASAGKRFQKLSMPTARLRRSSAENQSIITTGDKQDVEADEPAQSASGLALIPYKVSEVFHRDLFISWATIFSFGIFLAIVIVFVLVQNKLPPYLPLLYSESWGDHQLVPLAFFLILPLLIPALFLIHTIIAFKLHKKHAVLIRLLFLGLCTVSLLLAITQLKIVVQVMG